MPNNALYFPYINVPSTSWTAQAILYWDKLTSIVPMDHLYYPQKMDELTRDLLSEGLVEPISPSQFVGQVEKFDACFIEFIEKRVLPRTRQRQHEVSFATTRIHAEKLGDVPEYLVDRGLANRLDWAWYDVDTSVAQSFMAYLATVLGAIPEIDATPITDKALYSSSLGLGRSAIRRKGQLHIAKARAVILKSLLPIPAGPIDVSKLVLFKRRHGHLLPALRAMIETHCSQISLLAEAEERIACTRTFIENCNERVTEIEAALRPTFTHVTLASLVPLFGAGLALKATNAGDVVAYTGSALSLAGAAYQAISSIRSPRLAQEAKPLAYVAHARRVR